MTSVWYISVSLLSVDNKADKGEDEAVTVRLKCVVMFKGHLVAETSATSDRDVN